ncbi:MAG: hypothetical protein ABJG41_13955 [Cyclobacteriaceae bacterium]
MSIGSVYIKEVSSKSDLKDFIKFPIGLYKGNPYYVPPIIDFELSTLSKKKNPAFERDKARYWLAYQNDTIVGRVAGILIAPELEAEKKVRFGWVDFIDDFEVCKTLLDTVANWGKANGATKIHGPMGFTDLDFEGALLEGYDQVATQATIYNAPYYIDHYKKYGMAKAVDWIEARGYVPQELPEVLTRSAKFVQDRFKLRVLKFKRSKHIFKHAFGVIELLNRTYDNLYGYYPLTNKQIQYYVDLYFGFIRKEYVTIIVDKDDKIVCMAICMPSMSEAFQKAKGSLFPFSFIKVLKDFFTKKHLDLFLIAVDPMYQKLGGSALIFSELLNSFIKQKIKTIATGPMLEENAGVQNLWNDYKDLKIATLRRRCFIKEI